MINVSIEASERPVIIGFNFIAAIFVSKLLKSKHRRGTEAYYVRCIEFDFLFRFLSTFLRKSQSCERRSGFNNTLTVNS